MNEKIDTLKNERIGNDKKIADYEERIEKQKELIKKMTARNKEIDKEIEMQKGQILLQLLSKSDKSMEELEAFLSTATDTVSSTVSNPEPEVIPVETISEEKPITAEDFDRIFDEDAASKNSMYSTNENEEN